MGIVAPQQSAALCIDGMHDAVTGCQIDDSVDGQRRRDGVGHIQIERPLESQALHIGGVDLSKRAVVSFAEGTTVRQPVGTVLLVRERRVIDTCRTAGAAGGQQQQEDASASIHVRPSRTIQSAMIAATASLLVSSIMA